MPTPVPPKHQSNWVYGISDAAMSSYDADGTDPTDMEAFVTVDQSTAEVEVIPANNEGHATGTDWPTEQWADRHDVNIPFNIDPTLYQARRLLNMAFGLLSSSVPQVGVVLDAFTPMNADTSRQLPAYWMSEKCALTAHDALYPSCVIEQITFKGEETGRLNVSGNMRGSGLQKLGTALSIVAEPEKYYVKNTQATVIRATAAVPATPVETYDCGLQSFMFSIDNGMDQNSGYDPGCQRFFDSTDPDSGIIRAHHTFGRRVYTGEFIVWLETSSPELALLRSQAELNIKMRMDGAVVVTPDKNFILFEMHLAHYRTVVLGEKNGFVTLQISPEAFYDASANKIVTVSVQYATRL